MFELRKIKREIKGDTSIANMENFEVESRNEKILWDIVNKSNRKSYFFYIQDLEKNCQIFIN